MVYNKHLKQSTVRETASGQNVRCWLFQISKNLGCASVEPSFSIKRGYSRGAKSLLHMITWVVQCQSKASYRYRYLIFKFKFTIFSEILDLSLSISPDEVPKRG